MLTILHNAWRDSEPRVRLADRLTQRPKDRRPLAIPLAALGVGVAIGSGPIGVNILFGTVLTAAAVALVATVTMTPAEIDSARKRARDGMRKLPGHLADLLRRPSTASAFAVLAATVILPLAGCSDIPKPTVTVYDVPAAVVRAQQSDPEIQRLPEVVVHMHKARRHPMSICGPKVCRYAGVVKLPDEYCFPRWRMHIPDLVVDLTPEPDDPYLTMNVF